MKRVLLIVALLMIHSVVFAQSKVSGNVTITATAMDAGCGVKQVQFMLGTTNIGPAITTPPYTYVWDSRTVSDGNYNIQVISQDKSGGATAQPGQECNGTVPNSSTPVAPGSIRPIIVDNIPVDTTPPTVTITTPVAGATVTGKIDIAVVASDPNGVQQIQLFIDGQVKSSNSTSDTLTYNWNTNPYKGDIVVLKAIAFDEIGNGPGQATVSVTVPQNPN